METYRHLLQEGNGARNEPGSITGRHGPGWSGTAPFGGASTTHRYSPGNHPVRRILKWFMYLLSLEDPRSCLGKWRSLIIHRGTARAISTIKGYHLRGKNMSGWEPGRRVKRIRGSPRFRLHPRLDDRPDPFRHLPDVLGLDVDLTGPGDLGYQPFP